MFNRLTVALVGTAAAAMLPTAASATGYIQYTMSGNVSGTQVTQPMNGPGSSQTVSGRATFTYYLPATGTQGTTAYFMGGTSSFGSNSFNETGMSGTGRGQIAGTACSGTSGIDPSCGFARILDGWRGGSYDLIGTIDTFTATVMTAPVSQIGFSSYLLDLRPVTVGTGSNTRIANVAAVPEPATWVSMIAGFLLLAYSLRRRPARSTVAA
ncbi:hypothetical protein GGQ80_000676 [Sphingomonas jinjuensis]|uniref:PEP-CTERM protein-sorting domain-containing protein n=1 Tax=Sphingomonas jinjuensis TaxID=535907 RepID=A0A840FFL7_9SPHN|nr:PEP-CTERM sorting domain-containing protein [Sphingomonas jinjuensis]MBB4152788.1 hypothetical protein [Sphingomonas jinjuensis]